MTLHSDFIFPKYQENCFSNIPGTILNLFGIKSEKATLTKKYFKKYRNKYKNIILFLIDGLGFYQWRKYGNKYSLFNQLDKNKSLFPITAIFPSNTAPSLNTIHSGLTSAEHGLFEFNLYIKEVDGTIKTLRFQEIGNSKPDSLLGEKVDPEILFDSKTIYQLLRNHQIQSTCFISNKYIESVYSKVSQVGSVKVPFNDFSDLVVKLKEKISKTKARNYFFVYWDDLDVLSHKYGPQSKESRKELKKIANLFLKEFIRKIKPEVREKTLLIITADHGQIDINPKETIFLDKDKFLVSLLQKDKKGKPILPTGGPRDVFLHVKKNKLNYVLNYLKKKFKDKALIIKMEEAISLGFFGEKEIKEKFRTRLGNLLILPYKNYSFWREIKGKEFTYFGHHGGLSKEEMIIPFAICNLNQFL